VVGPASETGLYPPTGRRRRPLRWLFLGIGVAILLVGVVLLVVSLDPGAFGLHYRGLFPFGGGLLGVIVVLWGVLLLVRVAWWTSRARYGYGRPQGRRFDPAIVTARRRYARGEISREQFEQIVSDLRQRPGSPP